VRKPRTQGEIDEQRMEELGEEGTQQLRRAERKGPFLEVRVRWRYACRFELPLTPRLCLILSVLPFAGGQVSRSGGGCQERVEADGGRSDSLGTQCLILVHATD
jgi:hypothetical protein